MRKGLNMSAADAEAHQRRHFGKSLNLTPAELSDGIVKLPKPLPKPVKMTRPEREYGMILDAMKRRGEVMQYKFEGISLSWGTDPETGRQMWYTPDFVVWPTVGTLKMVETKGKTLFYTALVRFKGARAEWGMHFQFEMHQLSGGEWRRVA